jgi:hypothetical protein
MCGTFHLFFGLKLRVHFIVKFTKKRGSTFCAAGSADEVDHTAVGAAITTITTNLPEMTRGVRMIAALMEDESSGDKLLDAARKLCTAFSDLLKAAEPETKEVPVSLMLSSLELVAKLFSTAGFLNKYH